MTTLQARELVLQHVRSRKVNASWLASSLGIATKQAVSNWLAGRSEPRDPSTWLKIAYLLGLASPIKTDIEQLALDLALAVVPLDDASEAKQLAIQIIKKISEKS